MLAFEMVCCFRYDIEWYEIFEDIGLLNKFTLYKFS